MWRKISLNCILKGVNSMKKIIVVTLTMLFLLTACGNQIYGKYKVKDNGGIIEIKKNDKFEISNENEKKS